MHPILSQFRRVLIYLLAWIPIAGLLAYLLTVSHEIGDREALVLSVPLCLLYAFLCLTSWYSCRGNPLEKYGLGRLIATHLTAALIAAIIWAVRGGEPGQHTNQDAILSRGFSHRFRPEIPLVIVTGLLLYLLWVTFYYVIIAVEASRDAEARVMKASVLARDAELRALKAQVNPHFLFNSLNSISALTSSTPRRLAKCASCWAIFCAGPWAWAKKQRFLWRKSFHASIAISPSKKSASARAFGSKKILTAALQIRAVPPLLLQPLVENAVVHGIANLVEGGWIRLDVHAQNGNLTIIVENSFDPEAPPRRKSGVGLANVRQRLQARYGNRASFAVKTEGDRYHVALTLPTESEEQPA